MHEIQGVKFLQINIDQYMKPNIKINIENIINIE